MARNKIAMQYRIREIKGNERFPIPGVVGKFVAVPHCTQTLSTKGLVKHIFEHNGSFGKAVYAAVVQEIVDCLIEIISTGVAVKLDGLGTFRPTFECEPAASEEDFDITTNLKGVHLRLYPEGVKEEEITSRKIMSKMSFQKLDPNDYVPKDDEDEQEP